MRSSSSHGLAITYHPSRRWDSTSGGRSYTSSLQLPSSDGRRRVNPDDGLHGLTDREETLSPASMKRLRGLPIKVVCPVSEARAESMRHGRDLVVLKQPGQPRYRNRIPTLAREHERAATIAERPRRLENIHRPPGQRDPESAWPESSTRADFSAHGRALLPSSITSNASLTPTPSGSPRLPLRGAMPACAARDPAEDRAPAQGGRTGCRSETPTRWPSPSRQLMRWRTRRAVAGRTCQMRRSVSSTSALVTWLTGILPMCGRTYRVRLDIQS